MTKIIARIHRIRVGVLSVQCRPLLSNGLYSHQMREVCQQMNFCTHPLPCQVSDSVVDRYTRYLQLSLSLSSPYLSIKEEEKEPSGFPNFYRTAFSFSVSTFTRLSPWFNNLPNLSNNSLNRSFDKCSLRTTFQHLN